MGCAQPDVKLVSSFYPFGVGLEALPSVPDSLNRREKKEREEWMTNPPHSYGQRSQYGFFQLFYFG